MEVAVLVMAFRIFARAQKDSQDNTAKKDWLWVSCKFEICVDISYKHSDHYDFRWKITMCGRS